MSKTNKKQPSKKIKTFLEYTNEGVDLKKSLLLTRVARRKLNLSILENHIPELVALANRLGEGSKSYEMDSYPLKSDLAKIQVISSEWSKGAEQVSPRVVVGLALAWLFRDDDSGFSRVFPNGLYLENGVLSRMARLGIIEPQSAETGLKQVFKFSKKHPFFSRVSKDKELSVIECRMADATVI